MPINRSTIVRLRKLLNASGLPELKATNYTAKPESTKGVAIPAWECHLIRPGSLVDDNHAHLIAEALNALPALLEAVSKTMVRENKEADYDPDDPSSHCG